MALAVVDPTETHINTFCARLVDRAPVVRKALCFGISFLGPQARDLVPHMLALLPKESWQYEQGFLLSTLQHLTAEPGWPAEWSRFSPLWILANMYPEKWLWETVNAPYARRILWKAIKRKTGTKNRYLYERAQEDFIRQIENHCDKLNLPLDYPKIPQVAWGFTSNAARKARRQWLQTFVETSVAPATIAHLQDAQDRPKSLDDPLDTMTSQEMMDYLLRELRDVDLQVLRLLEAGLSANKAGKAPGLSLHEVRKSIKRVRRLLSDRFDGVDPTLVVQVLRNVVFVVDP